MRRAWRPYLYAVSALGTGALGFALLLAGWLTVSLLAVTPLVVPALVAFRFGVGALAELEARLARSLLGAQVPPQSRASGGAGYWGRGKAVVVDRVFWRQHAYVLGRTFVGWPLAVAALSLVGSGLWFVGLPAYYRFVDQDLGLFRVDTLEKAVLLVPVGVVGAAVSVLLVAWLAGLWRRLALPLLARTSGPPRRLLRAHVAAALVADVVVLVVWASVGGSFWPGWVLAATALPLALHGWWSYAQARRTSPLALAGGLAAAVEAFLLLVWALAGGGYLWPAWPALGLALAVGVVVFAFRQRTKLQQRIDVLETSRAGAVDVQETELRRIERDLHDGAQARLVALGMSLGMAEQKLAGDPAAARDLVAEARLGVEAALRELRDLARGIHPPVLADRGLEAALESLTERSPVPVTIEVDVRERPPAAVETAGYFVAAEAIANAGKHAGARRVHVRIERTPHALVLEIADDGRGGADPSGAGLVGLRRRVEALDGTLTVVSPSGGGTTLRAELPCAS